MFQSRIKHDVLMRDHFGLFRHGCSDSTAQSLEYFLNWTVLACDLVSPWLRTGIVSVCDLNVSCLFMCVLVILSMFPKLVGLSIGNLHPDSF